MSVIVKGLEMPKNCARCFVGDRTICRDECPLGEVPDDGVVVSEDEFQYYSRAMLVALTLHDLLVNLNGFAEVPKSIEPIGNAPAGNEAEDEV